MRFFKYGTAVVVAVCALVPAAARAQGEVSIGGFIPFVGIGMTAQAKTLDSLDFGSVPFIADPEPTLSAPLLGNGSPYFDIALLDTGAATHILTQQAFNGFNIIGNNLRGTQTQAIGGATGIIQTEINDAAGIYAAGLNHRIGGGATLQLDQNALRGQSSVATLTAPDEWTLPNILGLPMAAHHALVIRNDQPQIFQYQGRTVRTPAVEMANLGTKGVYEDLQIRRRAPLKLSPGIGFVQGPQYVFSFGVEDLELGDIFGGSGDLFDVNLDPSNNPASPSVIQDGVGNGGGLFLEVDLANQGRNFQDRSFLFDTGADMTVISQQMAARLGFDAVLDKPDFVLEVEGSGGVNAGVPGIYLDELNLDTIGGSFTLHNVPVAVLDVTNPTDPGNIIDGIIGMHLFNGRNIIIDANPSIGQGGVGPSLYISDPVTQVHSWASFAASASFTAAGSWSAAGNPNNMWDARAYNVSGAAQTAVVDSPTTVNRLIVGSDTSAPMTVRTTAALTTFGEVKLNPRGRLELAGGKVDAQSINIDGGELVGSGEVFVGSGFFNGAIRNISGRIAPGVGATPGKIDVTGDIANLPDGMIQMNLAGTGSGQFDQIEVSRFAFLDGTLEVLLNGGYAPGVGDSFALLTAGEAVNGEFARVLLPAGYFWELDYLATEVLLKVTGIGTLLGDFNRDGHVDAMDRDLILAGMGTTYSGADLLLWQRQLGVSSMVASVPEPAGALLLAGGLLALIARRRRR